MHDIHEEFFRHNDTSFFSAFFTKGNNLSVSCLLPWILQAVPNDVKLSRVGGKNGMAVIIRGHNIHFHLKLIKKKKLLSYLP